MVWDSYGNFDRGNSVRSNFTLYLADIVGYPIELGIVSFLVIPLLEKLTKFDSQDNIFELKHITRTTTPTEDNWLIEAASNKTACRLVLGDFKCSQLWNIRLIGNLITYDLSTSKRENRIKTLVFSIDKIEISRNVIEVKHD